MNHLITITRKEQMIPGAIPPEGLLDVGITIEDDIQEQPHNHIEQPNIVKESYELPNRATLLNHRIRSTHHNKDYDTPPTSRHAINGKIDDEDELCDGWIQRRREYKDHHKKVLVL